MRYADLPPAMKAKVDAQLAQAGQAPAKRTRTSRRSAPADRTPAGGCECGQRMTPGQWEKHADELGTGHRRYLCDLTSVS